MCLYKHLRWGGHIVDFYVGILSCIDISHAMFEKSSNSKVCVKTCVGVEWNRWKMHEVEVASSTTVED